MSIKSCYRWAKPQKQGGQRLKKTGECRGNQPRRSQLFDPSFQGFGTTTLKTLGSAVFAVLAITSLGVSADPLNPYLWEQMKTPSTDARPDARAEPLPAPAPSQVSSGSQALSVDGGGTAAKAGPALQDEPGPSGQTRPTLVKTGAN